MICSEITDCNVKNFLVKQTYRAIKWYPKMRFLGAQSVTRGYVTYNLHEHGIWFRIKFDDNNKNHHGKVEESHVIIVQKRGRISSWSRMNIIIKTTK